MTQDLSVKTMLPILVMEIIEKYTTIPVTFESDLALDLLLTSNQRRSLLEDIFEKVLPGFDWSMQDMTQTLWLPTVEEIVIYFEEVYLDEAKPPEKDFHFNF